MRLKTLGAPDMKIMHSVDTNSFALSGGFSLAANTQANLINLPSDKDLVLIAASSRAARDLYLVNLVGQGVKTLLNTAANWHRTRTTRQGLDRLDARLLRDIGLDRAAIQQSAINAVPGRVSRAVSAVTGYFVKWNKARLTRSALLSLNDKMLDDIGMNRHDVDLLALDIRAGRWPATATANPVTKSVKSVTMGRPVNNNTVSSWFIAPRKAA